MPDTIPSALHWINSSEPKYFVWTNSLVIELPSWCVTDDYKWAEIMTSLNSLGSQAPASGQDQPPLALVKHINDFHFLWVPWWSAREFLDIWFAYLACSSSRQHENLPHMLHTQLYTFEETENCILTFGSYQSRYLAECSLCLKLGNYSVLHGERLWFLAQRLPTWCTGAEPPNQADITGVGKVVAGGRDFTRGSQHHLGWWSFCFFVFLNQKSQVTWVPAWLLRLSSQLLI